MSGNDLRAMLRVVEKYYCYDCDFFHRDADGQPEFCPAPATRECVNLVNDLKNQIADLENRNKCGALNALAV